MIVIFICSSAANSNDATKAVFGDANYYIRKLAHMTEFALLFLLLHWSLDGPQKVLKALLLAFLYACSDEYHQSFVPGRSASFGDVLIDSAGITVAFFAVTIASLCRRKQAKETGTVSTEA